MLKFLYMPESDFPYSPYKAAGNLPCKQATSLIFIRGFIDSIKLILVPSSCQVISESMYMSLKYDIIIKTLVI